MTLLEEIENFFGTTNLYEVLAIDKDASPEQIKKAYRRASLKIHPDRVDECEKEKATQKFQALAQVHYVLSDVERRKLYDSQGIIANDDSLEGDADWSNYWRLLFPKISEKDIQNFLDSYVGSEEEEKDLISVYNRFKGDLDKISETHISYEEEATIEHLSKLIKLGKIPNYKQFSEESRQKRERRNKRAEREARRASQMKEELKAKTGSSVDSLDDLTALIKKKSRGNFENMIASLEAKYDKGKKGVKRKRSGA